MPIEQATKQLASYELNNVFGQAAAATNSGDGDSFSILIR